MTRAELIRDEALDALLAASTPPKGPLREAAAAAIAQLRLPGPKDEGYRFMNLAPLKAQAFEAPGPAATPEAARLAPCELKEAACRLVFVDGRYQSALSTPGLAQPLNEAEAPELGTAAGFETDVFAALNTRNFDQGAVVRVGRDTAPKAIHLLFLSSGKAIARYPRVLVVVGAGASATVVEEYAALDDGPGFTDAVSEVFLAENARLRHVRVQAEGPSGYAFGRVAARVSAGASYEPTTIATGARTSRLNLDVALEAEGAGAVIRGLTLVAGTQESDTHTTVRHLAPHGTSDQLHKNVVAGAAHAVFNGRIFVAKGAQQTDSAQSSRNLLLSEKARVDTKPQLEIFADDVKCAHGAAVGALEEDEVFYLRSRGMSEAAARSLLTVAFAAEVLQAVPVASLRRRLERAVNAAIATE